MSSQVEAKIEKWKLMRCDSHVYVQTTHVALPSPKLSHEVANGWLKTCNSAWRGHWAGERDGATNSLSTTSNTR